MPHSHTGKHNPSKPLTNVAKTPFLGKRPVMILDGTNTAIPPEIKDPSRTNGNPSNASARKGCETETNGDFSGLPTFSKLSSGLANNRNPDRGDKNPEMTTSANALGNPGQAAMKPIKGGPARKPKYPIVVTAAI